jgi:hypothetical protein
MANRSIVTAISIELEEEIKETVRKVKEVFGLEISKLEASRIIAQKNKKYQEIINLDKLRKMLQEK